MINLGKDTYTVDIKTDDNERARAIRDAAHAYNTASSFGYTFLGFPNPKFPATILSWLNVMCRCGLSYREKTKIDGSVTELYLTFNNIAEGKEFEKVWHDCVR